MGEAFEGETYSRHRSASRDAAGEHAHRGVIGQHRRPPEVDLSEPQARLSRDRAQLRRRHEKKVTVGVRLELLRFQFRKILDLCMAAVTARSTA